MIYDLVWDETEYGYFIEVMGNNAGDLWTMQLRVYFDQDHEYLSYLMIQFFQVSMPHHGHGVDLFNRLLRCSEAFKHLVMIRLTAGDEVGKKFWIEKNNFRLKGDVYDKITFHHLSLILRINGLRNILNLLRNVKNFQMMISL